MNSRVQKTLTIVVAVIALGIGLNFLPMPNKQTAQNDSTNTNNKYVVPEVSFTPEVIPTNTATSTTPDVAKTNSRIITIDDNGFHPSTITIKVGETVTFMNKDTAAHWPASNLHPSHLVYPEFDPKKELAPGASWKFTFQKAGTWRMHDHLSPSLTGTITVTGKSIATTKKDTEPIVATHDIDENSTTIFSNDSDLKSYVKKFGAAKTIDRLNTLGATYGDCHQSAHRAGHFAYDLFKEAAFKECSSECHSGCYHGATEAYFRDHGTDNLKPNLNTICGSGLNPFYEHQCVHGIGHGLMAWSDYELPKALESCNLLETGQSSCWSGVFMENIVGALSKKDAAKKTTLTESHVSAYLNDDPQYPCSVVDEQYKGTCYFLQTSRMLQLFGVNFAKVAQTCSAAPAAYHTTCFQSMGRDVGGVYRLNPSGAITACQNAPSGDDRVNCLSGAVQDYFWDQYGMKNTVSFCTELSDTREKATCYNIIIPRAKEVLSTPALRTEFCSMVQTDFKEQCKTVLGLSS